MSKSIKIRCTRVGASTEGSFTVYYDTTVSAVLVVGVNGCGVPLNNVTAQQLLAGVTIVGPDTIQTIYIYNNSGVCIGRYTSVTAPGVSPTPTATITTTPTKTPSTTPPSTVSPTATVTATVTPTLTATVTPTITTSNSITPTPSITNSNSVTPTPSITNSNSITPTPTVTATPSITNSNSVTPTITITPTITTSNSITPTPTITPTVTDSTSATPTPSITNSNSITPTPTTTPSITNSNSVTPTITNSNSITPTPTTTPSITNSNSVTPTITTSNSITPTPTITPTITNSNSVTPTITTSNSITPTPTITPTITNSNSVTPTITTSNSITPTPTITPTITNSNSITPTPTITPTITNSNSITPTLTPTPTITPSKSTIPITLTTSPSCAGGANTGIIYASNFSGGTNSYSYISISGTSPTDALLRLDNAGTRDNLGAGIDYTYTSLSNGTYYVAIMDSAGNKGVSTGTIVTCIDPTPSVTRTPAPSVTKTPSLTPTPSIIRTPAYTYQGYQTCYGNTLYVVYLDTNPNSYTYNNYFAGLGTYNLGTNPPATGSLNANWVNNGSTFCSGCVAYQPQIDNNPCSSTYNNTRNVNLGATAPCNYSANYSSAVGTLYVCNVPGGGVNSYTVYQNTNGCFTGNQYYATNGSTYATNPSNSAPDTTQNWQPTPGTSNYCSGVDLYQPQTQTNPCAINYGGTRDYLIEANSNTCAEVYVIKDCTNPSATGFSIVYAKGTFAVNDRVTVSSVTYYIDSITTTNNAGSNVLTSTGQTGCPQFTQFFDLCNGNAPYYVSATGLSGVYVSSEVSGGCLQVQGVTSSPTGTQISDYSSNPGCECV